MQSNATLFAVVWLLFSIASFLFSIHLYFANTLPEPKMALFLLLASVIFVGIGIFFFIYQDRLNVYLGNYHSEDSDI